MYNILFLNMPNVALFEKRPATPIISGFGFLVGSLKKIESKYLDLNIVLRNRRDEELLTEEEYNYLIKPSTDCPEKIDRYINLLLDYLEEHTNLDSFNTVAYSLDGTVCDEYLLVPSASFLILFNARLQERKQMPSYVGGINTSSIEIIKDVFKGPFPTKFFKTRLNSNNKDFLQYLILNHRKDAKRPTRDNMVFEEINHNRKSDYRLPENINEFLFTPQFPEKLVQTFPKITEVQPYTICTYKYHEGCLFRCAFCAEWDKGITKPFRTDSVENIIENLKRLEDQGVRYVNFINNNVNPSLKMVYEFGNAMVKNNIKIKWTDSCNLIVRDADMFKMLHEAGCVRLWFGAESVSPRMLNEIGKKISKEILIEGLTQSSSAGIWNNLNFIVNLPREQEEDLDEVISFLKENFNKIIDGFTVNYFDLRPSSKYYVEREKYGIKVYDYNIDGRLYKYDEPDRKWEEIISEGHRKVQKVFDSVNVKDCNLYENADFMFYSMLEAYKSKDKIREAINLITDNGIFRDVALFSSTKLKNHYQTMYKGVSR